jgi:hypothetical protein
MHGSAARAGCLDGFLPTTRAGLRTNRQTARTIHGPSAPDEITILGLSPQTIRGRFTGFFLGDVIDEFPRFHIEPCSDVQERKNAGAALSVLDIDETPEAQSAAFCEFFQAVSPPLSEATDLHTQGQESRVR